MCPTPPLVSCNTCCTSGHDTVYSGAQVLSRSAKAHDMIDLQRASAGLARTVMLLQPTGEATYTLTYDPKPLT